jgi:tRNA-specific 2-thiouridylase
LCNKEIKFKAFLDYALKQGADKIATGHYARVGQAASRPTLLRGIDTNKDQSYFLYTLKEEQLDRTMFPVGDLPKTTVRGMAKDAGIHLHAKKDSTGICFIGERKFRDFLAEYLPAQPGPIVSDTSEPLGTHSGLMFYTLGQRQGLGIGGKAESGDEAWYVIEKNLQENTLIVGQGHDHAGLLRDRLTAHEEDWVAGEPPQMEFDCTAKVRYRQADVPAHVEIAPSHAAQGSNEPTPSLTACFDQPVRAITPGQSVVFYQDQVCLGGAVISDFPPIMSPP